MRNLRTLSALLCAGYLLSGAYATVLNFSNITPFPNTIEIPLRYGDRVNASGVDSVGRTNFDLTFGATPNVQVQMFSADYQGGTWQFTQFLRGWTTGYAELTNVAYHRPSSTGGARFIFTADPGARVRLHSFQMGGYLADQTLPFLQVLVDGTPVLTLTNVPISGFTADTFTFDPNVVKGSVIEIRFGGDNNIAIDNIAFSQEGGGALVGDVNGDGCVDDADLLLVLFNFGSGCGS